MIPWRRSIPLRTPSSEEASAAARRAVAELIAALRGAPGIDDVLDRRVRLTVDSGGAASLPSGIVTGRVPVRNALRDLLARFAEPQSSAAEVNGAPGVVIRSRGRVVAVLGARPRRGRIGELWAVVNPDKLGHWDSR